MNLKGTAKPSPARDALVLGVMSGTSIDSVDYAICAIRQGSIRLRSSWTVAFPAGLRARLHTAAAGISLAHELAQLHHDLGRFYATAALRGTSPHTVKLAGLHGQTVFHNPTPSRPATLQLGEPVYLAQALGIPVVSNFRAADMAAGGQGAPLATPFHISIAGVPNRHVCVNNLGGISNVTSIDWINQQPALLSFDTGPANVLLDMAVRHFTSGRRQMDRNGVWARRGRCCERLLHQWLNHPFFHKRPPKSTGRELFGEPFFKAVLAAAKPSSLTKYDLLATLTEFTAASIALNYQLHLRSHPQSVILTGGGASNDFLVRRIQARLAPFGHPRVITSIDIGWPVQTIEPAAFALLAWMRFQRKPANLPQTTGAAKAVLLGQITDP